MGNVCPSPGLHQVTVKAGADGKEASTTFDLHITNIAPTVTSLVPSPAVALVGQPMTFVGTATDPSDSDSNAGFTWSVGQAPFDTCGSHTVTGRATDKDGGVSDPFTSAAVQVVEASFRSPLTAGARNVVKAGQVVAVPVTVGCAGTNVAGLTPTIRLLTGDVDPGTESDDLALLVPASASASDTSGVMRANDNSYFYNLKVPKSSAGTKYTVRVSPFEGAVIQVVLELR